MKIAKQDIIYADQHYDYYAKICGGLGDCIRTAFCSGILYFMNKLKDNETMLLIIASHNPGSIELFDNFKDKKNIAIINCGYWLHKNEPDKIAKFKLPDNKYSLTHINKNRYRKKYFAFRDINHACYKFDQIDFKLNNKYINKLIGKKYIVMSTVAGAEKRNLPVDIVNKIINVLQKKYKILIVYIGKNYNHISNSGKNLDDVVEKAPVIDSTDNYNFNKDLLVDLTDKADVLTTIELVRNSVGLVAPHSSLMLIAWTYFKPCLLLYPQIVLDKHHLNTGNDKFYNEGINWATTVHSLFDDFDENLVEKFYGIVNKN